MLNIIHCLMHKSCNLHNLSEICFILVFILLNIVFFQLKTRMQCVQHDGQSYFVSLSLNSFFSVLQLKSFLHYFCISSTFLPYFLSTPLLASYLSFAYKTFPRPNSFFFSFFSPFNHSSYTILHSFTLSLSLSLLYQRRNYGTTECYYNNQIVWQ